MTEEINQKFPIAYKAISEETNLSGFTMGSDVMACSLLCTLAATKPSGKFLELGTGTGLSTAFLEIAKRFLGNDSRLNLIITDGGKWIEDNLQQRFDYIFADTWHGKYLLTGEVLSMLKKGGFYIIDDMLPQPNWPEGHQQKATRLINYLETRDDLLLTKQAWQQE